MIDELTGLEVPPEIAAATQEAQREAAAKLNYGQGGASEQQAQLNAFDYAACPSPGLSAMAAQTAPAPSALIPFDEFERRIRILRENGVRIYQDNLIKVQLDTFKRQPDPVPLAHETVST